MTTTTLVLSALSLQALHRSTARSTSCLLGFNHWDLSLLPSNMCRSLFFSAFLAVLTAISGLNTFQTPSVPRIKHLCLVISREEEEEVVSIYIMSSQKMV